MPQWVIDEYKSVSGTSPIRAFIDSLEGRDLAEAVALIRLLQERGNTIREPRSKALGNGLYELRGKQVRIFYIFFPGRRVVLLDGIIKKQDRIPSGDLRRVRGYQQEIAEREKGKRGGSK